MTTPDLQSTPGPVAFPSRTLLEAGGLPLEHLAEMALREGHRTSPLFRVHRWFARRLRSQFRAVLTALTLGEEDGHRFWDAYFGEVDLSGLVVLDPFVGGGTTLVEASRCGARVLGYDIDPVAAAIVRFELGAAQHPGLPEATPDVAAAVSGRLRRYHRTTLEDGAEREVLHHFWVQVVACAGCGSDIEAHPHHWLAWDAAKGIAWVSCRACHAVHQVAHANREILCPCGATTRPGEGPLKGNRLTCASCGHVQPLAPAKDAPRYRLFAQEYLDETPKGIVRRFKAATEGDRALYTEAECALQQEGDTPLPVRPIPAEGRADSRPLLHGISRYTDLFNARQKLHLSLLEQALMDLKDAERRVLGLAFSEHLATNCMYAGYAFGYRRLSPLFSFHAFRHITRPVELNPWAPVGRGTFPNALRKLEEAMRFARAPYDLDPDGGYRPSAQAVGPADGRVADDPRAVLCGQAGAAVMARSAAELASLPAGSVDLVLTDPPYFDNVGYSELSDFYLAFQQALGIAEPPYDDPNRPGPLRENYAAGARGEGEVSIYRDRLSNIFRECRRVLKPEGLCVFTYHHRSADAWLALGEALLGSGLRVSAVVPMRGEGQGGLHTFKGTIKWDAVLVCRPAGMPAGMWPRMVVTCHNIECAFATVEGYRRRFAEAPHVGFREPDALNLRRALLVARAQPGEPGPDAVPLEDALSPTFALHGGLNAEAVEDGPRQYAEARL